MNQSALKRAYRGGRPLLVALLVGLISSAAVVVARPLDASAATVGISYVANGGGNSVIEYAVGATGNATPIRTISGALTGLSSPSGVALDAAGTLYVTNSVAYNGAGNSVTEYAAGADGNVAPIRNISGSNTLLNGPSGVVLDANGTLYVTSGGGGCWCVTEYANGVTGNATPIRTISGSNTGLEIPGGPAIDAFGTLYVVNAGSVTEYAMGANGNVLPARVISGSNTGLNGPEYAALDGAGTLYVSDYFNNSITEYVAGSNGNVLPVRTIQGASTGLDYPFGVAIDGAGTLHVANWTGFTVTEYAAGANGNVAPLNTIGGSSTGLNFPNAILVAPVPPTVTAVSPGSGPAAGGTPLSISGTGLSGATTVTFGTSPAASFTVASDLQIMATSPPGSGAVDVTVTTPSGISATSSADLFTYLGPPGPPTNVVALGGEASASVYWSPPFDGGSAITGYTVTASPGGATATAGGNTTSATVAGLTDGTSYTFTVTATTAIGTGAASAASNQVTPGLGVFHSLVPGRILDTRVGPVPSGWSAGTPLGPQGTITVQITGQGTVPSTGVSAVILNVTVTDTTAPSFLTIYPAGVPRPLASNLNWVAGNSVPNLVVVAVGVNGQVTAYNGAGSTDVIFDVAGYVSLPTGTPGANGLYTPVVPTRILDTRTGTGGFSAPVGPGQTINVQVAGSTGSGIPATGVSAVILNVTATGATTPSFLTVYPTGTSRPLASNLNFVTGQTVPNRVVVAVGINPQTTTSGWVSIYNGAGSVNVIADVGGWFTNGTDPAATGAAFVGMTPTRLIDTRNGHGPIGAAGTLILPIAGQNGVPATAKAVVLNVTVTNPTAPSFLTVWPDGATLPLASDLNYVAGLTVPNLVVVKVGSGGAVDFYNGVGSTDLIVDIVGWYG